MHKPEIFVAVEEMVNCELLSGRSQCGASGSTRVADRGGIKWWITDGHLGDPQKKIKITSKIMIKSTRPRSEAVNG